MMRRPGRRNARGARRGGAAGAWDPSQMADLEAWYRADNYAGATILDKGGAGRDLTVTGTAPPQVSRLGQMAIQANGAAYAKSADFPIPHPLTIYMLIEPADLSPASQTWLDSSNGASRVSVILTSTPAFSIRAGLQLNGGTPTLAPLAICAVIDGASSALYVNDFAVPVAQGDTGSNALRGVTLFAHNLGASNVPAGSYWWETVVSSSAHDAPTRKKMGDYLADRYSITIVT